MIEDNYLTKAGEYAAHAELVLGKDVHPKTASFQGFIAGVNWYIEELAKKGLMIN